MKYKDILEILAPCGLNCRKCFAFSEGEISTLSKKLQELLGAFDGYAERFSLFFPVFKNYPFFKELLAYFAQSDCKGCRSGTCKYSNCGIITCYLKKGVDFCFQCDEFPCENSNFDSGLKYRWIQMKKMGIESYFQETADLPRYR